MVDVSDPQSASVSSRPPTPGVTAIQAKVDERFQRETQVLFRARLITAARLTGIVLLLLILFDAALTWSKGADFPGPQLAATHLILGVLTLLLAGLLGGRDTGSLQLTDLFLFVPAAAGIVASIGFSGGGRRAPMWASISCSWRYAPP